MPPDFRLFVAPDYNNGKPGGKIRWVLYSGTKYYTFESLVDALLTIQKWSELWV